MAFRFGFGNDDDEADVDGGSNQSPDPETSLSKKSSIPPTREHDLRELVGKNTLFAYLLY